jgi:hypothetical protein
VEPPVANAAIVAALLDLGVSRRSRTRGNMSRPTVRGAPALAGVVSVVSAVLLVCRHRTQRRSTRGSRTFARRRLPIAAGE